MQLMLVCAVQQRLLAGGALPFATSPAFDSRLDPVLATERDMWWRPPGLFNADGPLSLTDVLTSLKRALGYTRRVLLSGGAGGDVYRVVLPLLIDVLHAQTCPNNTPTLAAKTMHAHTAAVSHMVRLLLIRVQRVDVFVHVV